MMLRICDYCHATATRVAWYGDDNTRFGGGQAPIYLCAECPAPCNHYADQHAGYTHETALPPGGEQAPAVGRY